jgi:subtilisin family serine protease
VVESFLREIARRVPLVVIAGNEGIDACTHTPGAVTEAIVVGAATRSDAAWSSSNWGPCVDVWAPGAGVNVAYAGSDTDSRSGFSGTSFAAPLVTGAIAQYVSRPFVRRFLTSFQAESIIVATSTKGALSAFTGSGNRNRLLYTRIHPF